MDSSTTIPPVQPVAHVVRQLRGGGRALVALSGGVDSGVVAALASTALGADATAVTLCGPAVSRDEVARASEVARVLGVEHVVLAVDPLEREEYRSNPSNRCYFCRSTEARVLNEWGTAHGVVQYLDGVHVDDLRDDRPGVKAMDEAGFRHPLLEAGWGKATVRAFARSRGLPNWDAPSEACLASRIPHGRPIRPELLERIERAEALVRSEGFRRVRVRLEGEGARVVVDPDEVGRLVSPATSTAVRSGLTRLGFASVELDEHGYRRRANS